jgi:hypothetical protein
VCKFSSVFYVLGGGEGANLSDFLCEQPGQVICRCVSPVDYGSDGLVVFMYLYESLYGRGRRVHVCVLPS